jgi:hypothetical protein
MHQDAVLLERRHPVTDGLIGVRRGCADRSPDLLEDRPLLRREVGNVLVDVARLRCGRSPL